MIGENMQGFIKNLLELTKNQKLEWKPISALKNHGLLMDEYLQPIKYSNLIKFTILDYSINTSYFIKKDDGIIVLADLICQKDSGPIYHKLHLLTKISDCHPLSNQGSYDSFGPELESLKLYIESNIAEKYPLPDTLYKFWQSFQ